MPIIGLAFTGAALLAGIKVLRQRFSPAVQPSLRARLAASAPDAAVDTAAVTPVPESNFSAAPLAALRDLVHDDEKRKLSVVMLTSATTWTHIALGMQIPFPLLVLNGVGYAALLTGHYFVPKLAPYRDQTRDALMAYTGTTIVGYFATCGIAGVIGPIGLINKAIEAGLIGVLWFDPGSAAPATDNLSASEAPSVPAFAEAVPAAL